MPAPQVVIPHNVPEQVILRDKEGFPSRGNGRELCAAAYKAGWVDFWKRYKENRIDLTDPEAGPQIPQGFVIESHGHIAGFTACRDALLARRAGAK